MKKRISALLALVLIFNMTSISVFADSVAEDDSLILETSAEIINQGFLNSIIGKDEVTFFSADVPLNISYSYTLVDQDALRSEVELNAVVTYAGTEFPITASGNIDKYVLEHVILWEGPLDGTAQINGSIYKTIVGFTKTSTSDKPQLNITISGMDDSSAECYLLFGDDLISLSMLEELSEGYQTEGIDNIEDPVSGNNTMQRAETAILLYSTTLSSNTNSNCKQRAEVYFSKDSVVSVHTKSYCSTLEQSFNDSKIIPSSYVDTVYIGLNRKPDTTKTHSWISEIEEFDKYDGKTSNIALSDIFIDLCSLFGLPTSTISSLVSNLSGSVTVSKSASNSYVSFNFARDKNVDFDSSGPIVSFQLDRNNTGYTGPSVYSVVTKLRYVTKLYNIQDKTIKYVYTDAKDVNHDISVTIA